MKFKLQNGAFIDQNDHTLAICIPYHNGMPETIRPLLDTGSSHVLLDFTKAANVVSVYVSVGYIHMRESAERSHVVMIRLDSHILSQVEDGPKINTPLDIVHISFLFHVLQIGIDASIDDEASRHMFESTMHTIPVDNSVIQTAFRNLSHTISGTCASIIKTSYHEVHRPKNLLPSSPVYSILYAFEDERSIHPEKRIP